MKKWTKQRRGEHSRIMKEFHDKKNSKLPTRLTYSNRPMELKSDCESLKYWADDLFVRQVGERRKFIASTPLPKSL